MKTFEIELPDGAVYKNLCWKEDLDSERECYKDYTVIWVDLEKFIHFAEKAPDIKFASHASSWEKEKREAYILGNDPKDPVGLLNTPRVVFNDDEVNVIESKLLGFMKKKRTKKLQYIGFVNGRHRTRIAEFLGAKKIPVQVHNNNAELMKKYCL